MQEVTNIVTSLVSLKRWAGTSAPLAYAPGVAERPPHFQGPGGTPPGGAPGAAARGRGLLKSKR